MFASKFVLKTLVACAAVVMPALAAHADTTYTVVPVTIGAGSATGSITTDGATGTLTAADILGFSFTISDGVNTVMFDQTTGFSVLFETALTATATGLYVDHTGAGSVAFADNAITGYVCYLGNDFTCSGLGATGIDVIGIGGTEYYSGPLGSNDLIATAATTTPEPSSLALLGTGVLGMVGAVRRRLA